MVHGHVVSCGPVSEKRLCRDCTCTCSVWETCFIHGWVGEGAISKTPFCIIINCRSHDQCMSRSLAYFTSSCASIFLPSRSSWRRKDTSVWYKYSCLLYRSMHVACFVKLYISKKLGCMLKITVQHVYSCYYKQQKLMVS